MTITKQNMRHKHYITLLLLSTIFFACGHEVKDDNNTTDKYRWGKKPVICVINIDGTGSYNYLEKAKNTALNIINTLPSQSRIYIRWISENSILDKNNIISAILPGVKTSSSNPYISQKTKDNIDKQKELNNKLKQETIESLISAKSPKANKTDIYGCLAAASERFKNHSDKKAFLILMSDMKDNVGRKFNNYMLNGVEVLILDFQSDDNSFEAKEKWTEELLEKGASNVSFAEIDEQIFFK